MGLQNGEHRDRKNVKLFDMYIIIRECYKFGFTQEMSELLHYLCEK